MALAAVGDVAYVDLDVLKEWVATAQPKARCLYVVGTGPTNPDHPVMKAVAGWVEQGLVNAGTVKGLGRGMVRRGVPATGGQPRTPTDEIAAKVREIADTLEGELFRYVEGLAADGLPMPTNGAIAEELGWRDKHQVLYRLRQLQMAGLVQVTFGKAEERILTVATTGLSTASVEPERRKVRA